MLAARLQLSIAACNYCAIHTNSLPLCNRVKSHTVYDNYAYCAVSFTSVGY